VVIIKNDAKKALFKSKNILVNQKMVKDQIVLAIAEGNLQANSFNPKTFILISCNQYISIGLSNLKFPF